MLSFQAIHLFLLTMLKSIFAFLYFIFYLHKYQKISKAHRFYWTKCWYLSLPLSLFTSTCAYFTFLNGRVFFQFLDTVLSENSLTIFRSSHWRCFIKKPVPKTPVLGSHFNKVAGLQACKNKYLHPLSKNLILLKKNFTQ